MVTSEFPLHRARSAASRSVSISSRHHRQKRRKVTYQHYCGVIMCAVASQITSLTIVYSTGYSDADKKTKLRVTGLCVGNSPETGEFPAQMASNAENVSIWWRHHGKDHSKPIRRGMSWSIRSLFWYLEFMDTKLSHNFCHNNPRILPVTKR